jgi:hypothetical protein
MSISAALALFGGTQVVLVALFAYLGKIWLARIEKNLEAALDKQVHASNLQFDREFKFYQKVWEKLSQLREAIRNSLEPLGDTQQANNPGVNSSDRITLLKKQAEDLYLLVEANEPFFPEEFAEDLKTVRELALHWSDQVASGNADSFDWFLSDGANHIKRMNEAYEALKLRIRSRLNKLGK